MKKSDVLAADIIIYALKQIQMAKFDMQLSGEFEYWNGEIMSMKYLLLYIDRRLGKKKKNDLKLPDIYMVFDRVDEKRKEQFEILWEMFWEEE
jgi:hypothetical protein